jgi:hypothetical protein
MNKPLLILSSLFVLMINALFAQDMPDTDIFLAGLKYKEGKYTFETPINITNRKDYDNQPSFTADGKNILFSSVKEDKQADIYNYNIKKALITQITQTPESEYAPTQMPDGKNFSTVRVEKDSVQRLWKFPMEGGKPILILSDIDSIGYHCWIDETKLVLFMLTKPFTLEFADVTTSRTMPAISNAGRCFSLIPNKPASLSVVFKQNEKDWYIRDVTRSTLKSKTIIKTLDGCEDYVWTPWSDVLMAKGSILYKFSPTTDKGWVQIGDFSAVMKNITRLAISKDGKKMCIVNTNDALK